MRNSNDQYKIFRFSEYNEEFMNFIKNLVGQNIYIFDIEVKGKFGLDLAREIRMFKKTMNDQIIIATAHQDLVQNAYHKKILMVDFISKFDDLEERLLCVEELTIAAKENRLEEAWGTGTAAVVSPIGHLFYDNQDYTVSNNQIGELTQRLYDELTGIQWGKREDKRNWVYKVKVK
jgi:DNA-binding response OmpR family regulator